MKKALGWGAGGRSFPRLISGVGRGILRVLMERTEYSTHPPSASINDAEILSSPSLPVILQQGMTMLASVPLDASGGVRKGGGLRGRVREFSRASRKRLRARAGVIDWAKTPFVYVCAFTFAPEHLPESPAAFRRCLDAFEKRFRRRFPRSFLLMVREFGTRSGRLHLHAVVGSPHHISEKAMFHAWGNAHAAACRDGRWFSRVRPGQELHALNYIAKYASKGSQPGGGAASVASAAGDATAPGCAPLNKAHNGDVDGTASPECWGRWWWCWGLEHAPLALVKAFAVPLPVLRRVNRFMRKFLIANCRKNAEYWTHSDRLRGRERIRMLENHARTSTGVPELDKRLARAVKQDMDREKNALRAGEFRADYLKGWRPKSAPKKPGPKIPGPRYNVAGWFVLSATAPDLARLVLAAIESLDPWACDQETTALWDSLMAGA